jgi:predicted hotdog family 3-hydroxylacyl-ACP dehydratase
MTHRTVSDRRDVARDVDSPGNDSGGVDCLGVDGRAIDHDAIAALVPHSGGMVLLDRVVAWDDSFITCRTRSHLDQSNPLRRAGHLSAICGVEYALQAAALHGGLAAGGATQRAGFLAALRDVALHADWLDDQAVGDLYVTARLERHEQSGSIYALELRSAGGGLLLSGRAVIAQPPARRP